MPIHPDDLRLTDYALGELDDAARTELERELAESPEAAQALAEIRRVSELLSASFTSEQGPALDEARRAAILTAQPVVNEAPAPVAAASAPARRFWSLRHMLELGVAVGIGGVVMALFLPALQTAREAARRGVAMNDSSAATAVEVPDDMGREYSQPPAIAPERAAMNWRHEALQGDASGPSMSLSTHALTDSVADEAANAPMDLEMSVESAPSAPEARTVTMGEAEKSIQDGITPLVDVSATAAGAALQPASQPAQPAFGGGYGGYPGGPASGAGGGQFGGGRPGGTPYGGRGRGGVATKALQKADDYAEASLVPADAEGKVLAESETDLQSLVGGVRAEVRTFAGESLTSNGEFNTEAYDQIVENAFKQVAQEPLSTFSIDVDTASYANVRRFLTQETLPPPGAVRIEEMLNYFSYDYAPPTGEDPFAVHVEVAQCPWEAKHRLVRIGIKGREIAVDKRPATNLVFLIDVSGSMQDANKLQLVKTGLRLLIEQLSENDRVAMVVYAGSSGQVLASTPGNQKEIILAALDQLEAGGSTNGAGGIEQAYQVAVENFIKGGTNRVILCTDGDFNVGVTDESQLVSLIEGKAKSGVFLSVLGFGMGNYKDATLEKLSDKGNGNYAYIDTEREARKVLVEQLSGTLVTIAKDVKLQLEFNPAKAVAYRLIGYENRILAKEDFNDDKKDAGEIGAGHTVTALYEVIPAGEPVNTPSVDELEYQSVGGPTEAAKQSKDLLMLKLRYKQPDGDTSKLMKTPVADSDQKIGQSSADFQFASSVAACGMLLRHSQYAGTMNYGAVLELAQPGLVRDSEGYRAEFIELVKTAQRLTGAK